MRSLAAAAAVCAALVVPTSASAATPPPPGANVACKPTAAHPYPVVLVHGTFANRFDSWQLFSPALKAAGYCVYALDYGSWNGSGLLGIYGVGPIERSAEQLADFVAHVRAETGAAKVDIVGHSQGGMTPRQLIKFLGGASVVDDLVGLAPSNHGTANPLAPPAGFTCPACRQQVTGSDLLRRLNSGDESPGPVSYTNLVTRYDEVVIPYTSGYLAPDPTVTNLTLQDKCPSDTTEHLRIIYDSVALQITMNALARSGPADPALQPACSQPGSTDSRGVSTPWPFARAD
jgi:triacylglycerol esterase/lipase EstA (alpha/beta hydrolase family)